MKKVSNFMQAVEKIQNKERFALFEDGNKCYFKDGTEISSSDLWLAIQVYMTFPPAPSDKPLVEVCPVSFERVFQCKYKNYIWK